MACFLVPAAEAAVVTVVTKIAEKKGVPADGFVKKAKWLTNTLWGGSALLAFEHAWHGEIIPVFPFLTNAVDAAAEGSCKRGKSKHFRLERCVQEPPHSVPRNRIHRLHRRPYRGKDHRYPQRGRIRSVRFRR